MIHALLFLIGSAVVFGIIFFGVATASAWLAFGRGASASSGPAYSRLLASLEYLADTLEDAADRTESLDADWEGRAKGLLKAELKRRGVTYAQLVEKLAGIGITDTEPNIRNKIARGAFTAQFLLQCLEAIGAKDLRLDYGA